MRIAALITTHHRPDLLGHLLNRLSGDLWQTYVHLDTKTDAAEFCHLVPRAHSFQSIYRIYWGSFSYVLATLGLMREALIDQSNTHFYLMSGQCFPVKTDEQIAVLLAKEAGNFITVIKMPVSHKPLERLTRWHFHDARAAGFDSKAVKYFAQKVFNRLPQRKIIAILRGMQPHGGSAWWLLNRETISAILSFVHCNHWYLDVFRWSLIPEEMFFQTIIAFLAIHPERVSPTFSKWIEGASHPLVVTDAILQEANASWHLMARKFDRVVP